MEVDADVVEALGLELPDALTSVARAVYEGCFR
jgi:hypothetical protein